MAVLKLILGGDIDACEYLLMTILSKIHTRQAELILGNLSTNIAKVGKE